MTSIFPIPSSLQDLERPPYSLLPYPLNFEDDDDEVTRADSFDKLARFIERSNQILRNAHSNGGGITLFENPDGEDGFDEWNNTERIQALYTLVRKSTSLSLSTRKRVVTSLCQAMRCLSSILSSTSNAEIQTEGREEREVTESDVLGNCCDVSSSGNNVVSQDFRDTFACHLYMLYSIMDIIESEVKVGKMIGKQVGGPTTPGKKKVTKKEKERKAEADKLQAMREECASTMMVATQSMARNKSKLWRRGVSDENVVGLPCRIAYQMLEVATGVNARRMASADVAVKIIAVTLDSTDCLMSTVVAALMDMLHSFEHMAPLVVDICCICGGHADSDKNMSCKKDDSNGLPVKLLREVGRLKTSTVAADEKASGVKNVAPFINELAEKRPRLVLQHINVILRLLNCEPYNLRSAIVSAIGHILIRCKENEHDDCGSEGNTGDQFEEQVIKEQEQKKTRDSLFDILTDRTHDTSSYTRVTVLKTWANLISNQSLPVKRISAVTSLAIDRLQDKAIMVRRCAMQILTLLLENNPFTDTLNPKHYLEKCEEVKTYIFEHLPSHLQAAFDSTLEELDETEKGSSEERIKIENATILSAIAELDALNTADNEEQSQFSAKLRAHQFLHSALEFINLFESAHSTFDSMLLSSNNSDVTEALRFFVRARHFQLPCAVTGIKQALSLMWSNDTNIQNEVLTAFVEVFIAVPGTESKKLLPAAKIVHNLMVLVNNATVSEIASIEEAIRRLVKDEIIPAEVFLILWSIALKANDKARSAAMLVLSMGASCDPSIVDSASRLRHLLEAGLGEYTEEKKDWVTAKSAACALQRISNVKPDPASAKAIVLELIMERLCAVIQGDWCDDSNISDTHAWFGAAEQAINAVFVISAAPELVCRDIIQVLESTTFGFSQGTPQDSCHSLRLSRFFFVVSHISLKLLVYTESISTAVRRANAMRTVSKQEEADKAKSGDQNTDGEESDKDDAIENELGVSQAAEADTESKVAEIAEKEIVGRGMIGLFTPLLVRIVSNEDELFSSEVLMQTSTLALCKFMCISRSFCEKYLPLLFTALSKAPTKDVSLRANTVIALGDLAFRFPNEVEPYTPRLYACLKDKSTRVRRHTLMVLTHLILNDMVKVKGQVCEIALCLRDNEVRIRDMARLLFNELSKRSSNPIYNLLPDIVSRLSAMAVKKEDFRGIMSFLLNYIKKDRQNEMLADKLCNRFPKCTSISQKANISFCLAQLKMNEKSVRLLNDLFKLYKDALFDEDVMKNFLIIVTKAKKIAKPEMKEFIEEWEVKLKENSASALENKLADSSAERAQKHASRRKNQSKSKRTTVLSSKISDYQSDQESDQESSYLGKCDVDELNSTLDDKEQTDKENIVPLHGM